MSNYTRPAGPTWREWHDGRQWGVSQRIVHVQWRDVGPLGIAVIVAVHVGSGTGQARERWAKERGCASRRG